MAVPAEKLSLENFLEWENSQETRNEFYNGEVFAMVGGRRAHSFVTLNLAVLLQSSLKGTRCRTFAETRKLQLANNAIFYPDVFVTCDATDLKAESVCRHPSLIVEVLSDSTQAYDRSFKFTAYRQLESLKEYVLIDPDTRRIEVFRRNERMNFELHDQTGHTELILDSVGLHLNMEDVFDGVDIDAA